LTNLLLGFGLYLLPVFHGKQLKTALDFLPIEERHREKTDTAV
jgi:hypothetical protein